MQQVGAAGVSGPPPAGGSVLSVGLVKLAPVEVAPKSRMHVGEAVRSFFDADDQWERPVSTGAERRLDAWVAVAFFVFGAVGLELTRSMGLLEDGGSSLWAQYAALLAGTVPLAWRRRHPISVMLLLQLHLFVTGVWVSSVSLQFPMQVLYFFALYSGVAWARDRSALITAVICVLTVIAGWLAWSYAWGNAIDEIRNRAGADIRVGLVGPIVAAVLYSVVINAVYFGGALLWGRGSWRAARRAATAQEQTRTIKQQAAHLRDQAVVDERLRIARELHDVVAHHVSVMGIQAAAARRVLTRDPEAAAQALSSVESSSRAAVGELRSLLGTLRDTGTQAPYDYPSASGASPDKSSGPLTGTVTGTAADRAPEPRLSDLPALVTSAAGPGFVTTYELVEDAPGVVNEVPGPLSLSTYRIVQEALSNVRRHSTAGHAHVVVRVETASDRYVEAEVVDDGRPRGATSGTGLGLLGMRERTALHGGQLDVGPRLLGGYRVRVRFPFDRPAPETPAQSRLTHVAAGIESMVQGLRP